MPTQEQLLKELSKVSDPELGRNIVELGMVKDLQIGASGLVTFTMALTIPGCPMKNQMERDARMALLAVRGVKDVKITFGAMSEEQRRKVIGNAQPKLPKLNQFNHITKPRSRWITAEWITRIYSRQPCRVLIHINHKI